MKHIYTLIILFLFPGFIFAQYCNVVVSPLNATVCLGDSVFITAQATIVPVGSNQMFDFNSGNIPAGWASAGGNTYSTPCGQNPTGTPYYWASTSATTPQISTAAFDVSCGGEIIFDMRYAVQSGPAPCEGPDLADEGVELQFSTNGGTTWIPIQYYHPNGTILPSIASATGPGISGPTPWTTWSTLTVPIPVAAIGTSTMFRWIQLVSTSMAYDNWGLDNIIIAASGLPCNQSAVINWNNGLMNTNQFYASPTANSTFTALIYDALGNFMCQSQPINIQVNPDVMTYSLVDTVYAYCQTTSPSVEVTNFGGTFGPWGVNWTNLPSTNNPVNFPASGAQHDTTVYYVDITDGCNYLRQDSVVMITNLLLQIDSLISYPTSSCNLNDGSVFAYLSGLTDNNGQANYHWTGPNAAPGQHSSNGIFLDNIPSGWYFFTVEDDVCTASGSVFIELIAGPVAQFTEDLSSGCRPFDVVLTNNSQNANNFYWDFGNDKIESVSSLDSQNQTYLYSTIVTLIAYSSTGCSDTAMTTITVVNCGCNDPDALNYNPNALDNDGSCLYPQPIVVAPNVFTPNGDDINSYYFLDTKFVGQLELIIMNRWGNVLYAAKEDVSGKTFVGWNGKAQNGNDVDEGTYFYKYVAQGIYGSTVEGNGFLHLIK